MRRHWKNIALLAGVAVLACVLVALFAGESEPAYQGRKLSDWINCIDTPNKETEALLKMGTNAFPLLLKWVFTATPRWRVDLEASLASHRRMVPSVLVTWLGKNDTRAGRAAHALGLFQTNAYCLLPQLNSMATNRSDSAKADRAGLCAFAILYGYSANQSLTVAEEEKAFFSTNPIMRQAAINAHCYFRESSTVLPVR